ncbi:MAG TPA: AbrB/MazE/SpoVT family DNA-binding domain-containing protein [archaeon]|nr:AbrB/MazE/SpoVT family DNA-binding domain-containing protein [archaeon]
MEQVEVTSMSSRGQVVIPQNLRESMRLDVGAKFVVVGEGDTIVLKKIGIPQFEGFGKLLKTTQEWAQKNGLNQKDIVEARKRV